MNKKILMIIDSLGAGGAEKVILNLSRTLINNGHDVSIIIILDRIDYDIDFDIPIYTLNFEKKKLEPTYLIYAHKLRKLINKLEKQDKPFDLIVSHLQISHRLVSLARIPYAYYCIHSSLSPGYILNRKYLRRYLKRRKLKAIFDNQDILAIAESMATDLIDNVYISPKSISVINNAIDFSLINNKANEINPYANENYIIHIGRFTGFKRHDRLLEAYKKANISEKLILLGDGELRNAIEHQIDKLGLQDKVILGGFRQNPYPIIKGAKLTVLSSDYEGLPTVIIESLGLGVPVISTDCPSGPREILTGQSSNYLVPIDDVAALANKIHDTLAEMKNNPDSYQFPDLSRFSPENVSQQYLNLANRRERLADH